MLHILNQFISAKISVNTSATISSKSSAKGCNTLQHMMVKMCEIFGTVCFGTGNGVVV